MVNAKGKWLKRGRKEAQGLTSLERRAGYEPAMRVTGVWSVDTWSTSFHLRAPVQYPSVSSGSCVDAREAVCRVKMPFLFFHSTHLFLQEVDSSTRPHPVSLQSWYKTHTDTQSIHLTCLLAQLLDTTLLCQEYLHHTNFSYLSLPTAPFFGC